MDRIAIMGLGPIGASLGLALKRAELRNVEVVGFDRNRRTVSQASDMGAIDRGTGVYVKAVDGAQLVVLDLPMTEASDVLGAISHMLAEGCVVTDTRATRSSSLEAATERLPRSTSFIGGHPLPKTPAADLSQASAALFDGADYCVIPSKSADNGAVGTVVGMVETVGARPFFLDPEEHDAYVAAVTDLPQLLSYALVNATTRSASWRDMARFASEEFGAASSLAANDPRAAVADSLANRDALVHWVDQIIGELYSYRNDISKGGEDLETSLVRAWENRAKWKAGVTSDEKKQEIPSARDTMAGWLVSRRLWDRQKQITDATKREPWEYPKKD